MSSRKKWACYCLAGSLFVVYLVMLQGRFGVDKARFLVTAHAADRQDEAQTGSREKLRELLKERHEILRVVLETEKKRVRIGQGSLRDVAAANAAMLRAEADLCSTDSERIKIHEEIVRVLRECEVAVAREADDGYAPAGP